MALFQKIQGREVGVVANVELCHSAFVQIITALRVTPSQVEAQLQVRDILIALVKKKTQFAYLTCKFLEAFALCLDIGNEPMSIIEVSVHLANKYFEYKNSDSHADIWEIPDEVVELEYLVLNNMFGSVGNCNFIGSNSDYAEQQPDDRELDSNEEANEEGNAEHFEVQIVEPDQVNSHSESDQVQVKEPAVEPDQVDSHSESDEVQVIEPAVAKMSLTYH